MKALHKPRLLVAPPGQKLCGKYDFMIDTGMTQGQWDRWCRRQNIKLWFKTLFKQIAGIIHFW